METIDYLVGVIIIVFGLIVYAAFNKKTPEHSKWHLYMNDIPPAPPPKEIVKVTDDLIDNSIFDMFPSWRSEFNDDEQMREIEASCDLYVAVKNLLKEPRNLMLIMQLSDAADKYEKYVLK